MIHVNTEEIYLILSTDSSNLEFQVHRDFEIMADILWKHEIRSQRELYDV